MNSYGLHGSHSACSSQRGHVHSGPRFPPCIPWAGGMRLPTGQSCGAVVQDQDKQVHSGSCRIEERIQEMMVEGTIIVDTEGKKVGQINGLAVLGMGDYLFGKPSRITAKLWKMYHKLISPSCA